MNNSVVSPSGRPYRMTARAQQAADTAQRILDAAKQCFENSEFNRVRLADIARMAAVTEQTVIRRFDNKEGLLLALIERELPRVEADRVPKAGESCSLAEAIQSLVEHYEKDGSVVLNFLSQETRSEEIRLLLERGRQVHEDWVKTYCREVLVEPDADEAPCRLSAIIAATDVSTWKILRQDRGHSAREVEQIMLDLIQGWGSSRGS